MKAKYLKQPLACIFWISVTACAQESPSFDCTKARTAVERALCAGGNSGMGWLDQTMSDLYKAALTDQPSALTTLRSTQRAWLARRDRCTGQEAAIANCLYDTYRMRFEDLSSPYDNAHVTGTYVSKRNAGSMDVVLFPDGTAAVNASANLGPPSYNSCELSFRAPLGNGRLDYAFPVDDGGTSSDPRCHVKMIRAAGGFLVKTEGCETMCGANVQIDGTYSR